MDVVTNPAQESAYMWERVNVPMGVEQCTQQIFAALMVGGLNRKDATLSSLITEKVKVANIARARFKTVFSYNVFYNSYAVFYEIFETLNVKTFTVEQLIAIVENNRDLILDSPYINKDRYSQSDSGNIASDDDVLYAVLEDLKEKFVSLSYMVVDEATFISGCTQYINWYKNVLMEFTSQNMSAMMTNTGIDIKLPGKRSRTYKGVEDAREYYSRNMAILDSLSTEGKVITRVLDMKWVEQRIQEDTKPDDMGILDTGISEIDNVTNKLRRGWMVEIMGPPKGGKTTFTNYLVQRALGMGLNVCVWVMDGHSSEWEAKQIACLIAADSHEAIKQGKGKELVRIAHDDILNKRYIGSEQQRRYVNAARLRIASGGDTYGRLSFIDGTGYLEDFLDIIQNHWETENPFDVLVIDSLINIMSKKGVGKVERLSEAFMKTKDYVENKMKRPALALVTAQIKQTVVDYIRDNPDEDIEITAGGETAETARTPDKVIGLFSSKEERASNIMRFYDVASRHSAQFQNFSGRCYLDCCYFMSESEEERIMNM